MADGVRAREASEPTTGAGSLDLEGAMDVAARLRGGDRRRVARRHVERRRLAVVHRRCRVVAVVVLAVVDLAVVDLAVVVLAVVIVAVDLVARVALELVVRTPVVLHGPAADPRA